MLSKKTLNNNDVLPGSSEPKDLNQYHADTQTVRLLKNSIC